MHFEDFVNDMEEETYKLWYDETASPKQREVADRIVEREEIDEDNVPVDTTPTKSRESLLRQFVNSFRALFK